MSRSIYITSFYMWKSFKIPANEFRWGMEFYTQWQYKSEMEWCPYHRFNEIDYSTFQPYKKLAAYCNPRGMETRILILDNKLSICQ